MLVAFVLIYCLIEYLAIPDLPKPPSFKRLCNFSAKLKAPRLNISSLSVLEKQAAKKSHRAVSAGVWRAVWLRSLLKSEQV